MNHQLGRILAIRQEKFSGLILNFNGPIEYYFQNVSLTPFRIILSQYIFDFGIPNYSTGWVKYMYKYQNFYPLLNAMVLYFLKQYNLNEVVWYRKTVRI